MKPTTFMALIALLGHGVASAAPARSMNSGDYATRLDVYERFVREQMELDGIPGLTIGFVKDGTTWIKGFGYADLENRVPATAQSSYRLASITKSMTAVAVLQLVEKGKVDLDAEVQAYVPAFPRKKWPVTVRHLLLHLSGLRHNSDAEKVVVRRLTTREAVAQYADSDLLFEPGTKFGYSTPGYVLLGAVIENASGQTYADYMRRNVWEPLDMRDTRMDDPSGIIPNRVRGYRWIDGRVGNSQAVDVSNRFAGGGVRTTVEDMLKFAGGLDEGRLLSRESLALMAASGVTRDGRLTDAGMGWFLGSVNGRFTLENNGGQQETRTELVIFPRERLSIALAMNFEFNDYMPFVHRLYQLLMDEPWSTYSEKRVVTGDSVSDALIVAMQNAFFYGASYYDQHREAISRDAREIADAFAYFNRHTRAESLRSGVKESLEKFEDALNPITGQPFVRMGSFMAEQLRRRANGPGGRPNYHQRGAIGFFADYIEMYRMEPGIPADRRFGADLERRIMDWSSTWSRTCDDFVRRLWITPSSDLVGIERRLRATFANAEVHPNLNRNLTAVTWQLILKGRSEEAAKLGRLSVDLYPRSDLSCALLGIASVALGREKEARSLLRRGAELRGRAPIFGRAVNSYARAMAERGMVEDAVKVLLLTSELYPAEAALYESIGEMYSKAGDAAKAVEFGRRALALDPDLERAREIIETLGKQH